MITNPYDTYKQQSVMTMTSGQMLIMVYNELIKQLSLAQQAFTQKDISGVNRYLQKSQKLIRALKGTLNFDYSISESLDNLYDFFLSVVINANVKKDPSELQTLIEMITELRDTFTEADKLARV